MGAKEVAKPGAAQLATALFSDGEFLSQLGVVYEYTGSPRLTTTTEPKFLLLSETLAKGVLPHCNPKVSEFNHVTGGDAAISVKNGHQSLFFRSRRNLERTLNESLL